MVRKISQSELAELQAQGKAILDPETREVARFGELIDKLQELISSNADRNSADLARSQVQLEVLATMQKSIKVNGTKSLVTPDTSFMEPLMQILREIQAAKAPDQTAYQFDIQRADNNGPMQRVIATPIQPTQH